LYIWLPHNNISCQFSGVVMHDRSPYLCAVNICNAVIVSVVQEQASLIRCKSPVHIHVDDTTPVHVHVQKKKAESVSVRMPHFTKHY